MRGLFWFLGIFFLAVALALAVRYNEGFVLLVHPPWSIQLALNLALFGLLLLFVVLYAFIRGFVLTFELPGRARLYRDQQQQARSLHALERASRFLAEGRWGHALQEAETAYAAGQVSVTAALLAVRAASALQDQNSMDLWIYRARQVSPELEAALLLQTAQFLLDTGAYAAALESLQHFYEHHGQRVAALQMELQIRHGLGDQQEVSRLLSRLYRRRLPVPGFVSVDEAS